MNLGALLQEFANDQKVQIVLLILAADFFLGILAALRQEGRWGTFKFSYVSDYLKTDVLGKVLPYFVLYSMALVAGGQDLIIPGLDFGVLAGAAYVTLVAAFAGSILSSLTDLGITPLGDFLGEKPPPQP